MAVVHCKAGKGRTGVMICCFLLHMSEGRKSADEVLTYYARRRTTDAKGVTIPSQRRYIDYYSRLLRCNLEYRPVKLLLTAIVLNPVPNFGVGANSGEFYLQFEVKQPNGKTADYESIDYLLRRNQRQVQLVLDPPLVVCGDVKVEFSYKLNLGMMGIKPSILHPKKEFHFWFNSYFVDSPWTSGEWKRRRRRQGSEEDGGGGVPTLEEDGDESATATADELESNETEDSGSGSGGGGRGSGSGLVHLDNNGCNGVDFQRSYPPPMRHASSEAPTTMAMGAKVSDLAERTNLMRLTSVSDDYLPPGSSVSASATDMSQHGVVGEHHKQHQQHHVAFSMNPHHTVHATSSASSCSTSSNSSSSYFATISR